MEYPLDRFRFGATEKSIFGRSKPLTRTFLITNPMGSVKTPQFF